MNKLMGAVLVFLFLISCGKKQETSFDICDYYTLQQPDEIWTMPYELNEISGIVMLDHQNIIAENDEEGKLFIYNLKNKSIEKTILFAKKGDYEDIAINGGTAYLLRSDGTIFEIKDYKTAPKTIKHHTFLSKEDDTEGMVFDVENNRLLIACKGNSNLLYGKNSRLIYEFVLNENSLNPQPIIAISQKDIRKKYKSANNFSPSGIAIHPSTKNIFVITTTGKMMAKFSSQGILLNVFDLDYPHFQQPEGISFSKMGDLYISNEAKGNNATILKFNSLL